jgi:hypothetical protein
MISYLRTNATLRARVAELEGMLDAAERESNAREIFIDDLRGQISDRDGELEKLLWKIDLMKSAMNGQVVRGPGGRFVKC